LQRCSSQSLNTLDFSGFKSTCEEEAIGRGGNIRGGGGRASASPRQRKTKRDGGVENNFFYRKIGSVDILGRIRLPAYRGDWVVPAHLSKWAERRE
jgi:hypothetical protein